VKDPTLPSPKTGREKKAALRMCLVWSG
jgi:hypothetical protein